MHIVISSFDSSFRNKKNESREKDLRASQIIRRKGKRILKIFSKQNIIRQTRSPAHAHSTHKHHANSAVFLYFSLVLHFWFPRYFCTFVLLIVIYIFVYYSYIFNIFVRMLNEVVGGYTNTAARNNDPPRDRKILFLHFDDDFVLFICLHVIGS